MPTVNGKYARSFSQGISHAKDSQTEGKQSEPDKSEPTEGMGKGKGMVIQEKGGKLHTKTKHEDGTVTNEEHGSPAEMKAHVDSHFPEGDQAEQDTDQDDQMEYGGGALASVKGCS